MGIGMPGGHWWQSRQDSGRALDDAQERRTLLTRGRDTRSTARRIPFHAGGRALET